MTKIGVFVGSLRKESFSKKIAKNVAEFFPKGYETEFVEIGNLPLYNQDFDDEGTVPEEITTFRNTVKAFDAVLFVTPEYNRSGCIEECTGRGFSAEKYKRLGRQTSGNY